MVAGNMKIKLPVAKSRSNSPSRGRVESPSGQKKAFPTTPRSIEKAKKVLQAKLKRCMEDNIRLKAHNRCLKDKNEMYLNAFADRDVESQKHRSLNSNARKELNFKMVIFHKIKYNLSNIDQRETFQHKNLKGLIKFAKKLTIEMEQYKQKVLMTE